MTENVESVVSSNCKLDWKLRYSQEHSNETLVQCTVLAVSYTWIMIYNFNDTVCNKSKRTYKQTDVFILFCLFKKLTLYSLLSVI